MARAWLIGLVLQAGCAAPAAFGPGPVQVLGTAGSEAGASPVRAERRGPQDAAAIARPQRRVNESSASQEARRAAGVRIAATVRRWVGLRSLRRVSRQVTDDCSGLVRLAYAREGIDVVGEGPAPQGSVVKGIYLRAKRLRALRRSAPRPGDLVFFRNTFDRNKDGKRNDGLTHIGIVERVEEDGTVLFIHRGGQGVVRARMNLAAPAVRKGKNGQVLNDYLRRADGTLAPRLAGQLFAGYASPEAFRAAQAVARRPAPGVR